jgi:cell wall-associated NlpC family hydrolase
MARRASLATAFVAAVLTLSLPSVVFAAQVGRGARPGSTARPGSASPSTAQPGARAKASRPPAKARKPKTPPIPAKAKPLLRRLLEEAAVVDTEDEKAALLSERFDVDSFRLAKARQQVKVLDRRTRAADQLLTSASARLRQAAVVAYITGDVAAADASVLSDTQSQGQMAEVYSGVAIGQLRHALGLYEAASAAEHAARTDALANSRQIAANLKRVSLVRAQARSLIRAASREFTTVSRRLRRLVGRKEYARLVFAPWPVGSPYTGPNLAGTDVSTVATFDQGAKAAAEALRFLGVPYVFGGAGKSGVDCSGLTMLAWASAGYLLPHSATLQWEESQPVPLMQLEPGDLLFYHFANDGSGAISHVVMYLGSGPFGVETVVQAAEPGTNVAVGKIYLEGLVSAGRP